MPAFNSAGPEYAERKGWGCDRSSRVRQSTHRTNAEHVGGRVALIGPNVTNAGIDFHSGWADHPRRRQPGGIGRRTPATIPLCAVSMFMWVRWTNPAAMRPIRASSRCRTRRCHCHGEKVNQLGAIDSTTSVIAERAGGSAGRLRRRQIGPQTGRPTFFPQPPAR